MTARQPHPPSPLDRLPLRDRVASGRAGAQQSLVEIIFTRRKLLNLTAPQILRARALIVTNQTLPTAHGMSQYVWRTPKSQGSFYSVRTSTHASDVPLYDGSSTNFGYDWQQTPLFILTIVIVMIVRAWDPPEPNGHVIGAHRRVSDKQYI